MKSVDDDNDDDDGQRTTEHTTLKKVRRGRLIFSTSPENKIRSIKIHDYINNSISNSGSVSFCIQKCALYLTQTTHE